MKLVNFRAKKLFEHELEAWCADWQGIQSFYNNQGLQLGAATAVDPKRCLTRR